MREDHYIATGEHFDAKERRKQEERKKKTELSEPLVSSSENRAKLRAKYGIKEHN